VRFNGEPLDAVDELQRMVVDERAGSGLLHDMKPGIAIFSESWRSRRRIVKLLQLDASRSVAVNAAIGNYPAIPVSGFVIEGVEGVEGVCLAPDRRIAERMMMDCHLGLLLSSS
jgi:hypothetical protein